MLDWMKSRGFPILYFNTNEKNRFVFGWNFGEFSLFYFKLNWVDKEIDALCLENIYFVTHQSNLVDEFILIDDFNLE